MTSTSPSVDIAAVVADPARISALHRLAPFDARPSEALDRLARLTARTLRSPLSLVTLIDGDRQQIKASFGLPKGLSATRETPLTWSVCQYAVGWGGPMIVCDARVDHWLDDNPAVTKYGLRAYAGVPLVTRQGHAVGALCVIDRSARDWTAEEVADLGDLAEVVMRELRVERLEWRLDHEHSTAVFSSPKPGKRGRTSWRDAG